MPIDLLTPQIRDIVTNLVTGVRRPQDSWRPSPDEERLLVVALEQILADAVAFDDYLQFLQSLLATDPPAHQLIEGEDEEKVLAQGLGQLSHERIRQLAIDPVALLGLHDAIVEAMPGYWWTLMQERGRHTGRVKTKEVLFEQLFGKPFTEAPSTTTRGALVGAFQTGDEPAKVGEAQRWTAKHGEITIEFSLLLGSTSTLEVRLFGELNLAPSVQCDATLTRGEHLIARGEQHVGKLAFTLPTSEVQGLTLNIEHRHGEKQVNFSLAVLK